MSRQAPEIIEVDSQRIDELLQRAQSNTLRDDDLELMRQLFASYRGFFQMAEDKNTKIARLRKWMFGAATETSKNILGDSKEASNPSDGDSSAAGDASGIAANVESGELHRNEADDSKEPPSGHGRYGVEVYPGAEQVDVKHPQHSPGDACPDCGQGTLYEKSPGVLVRFVGQAPLHATVYRMQKLRCHLCGKLFTSPTPAGIGEDKYDHTVASMIGLLKYGSGLPLNRLERLQGNCEIPLQPQPSGTSFTPPLC